MSCEISVIYPGLGGKERVLEIPETRRSYGVINFGSDPTVCFGDAPGMGGFVLDRWEAEEYGILPRHCALLWAGGKFRLEFDRHAGVYLNGSETCARSFCNPFEDGAEFEMRLGLPDTDAKGADLGIAPVFRVRRKDVKRRRTDFLNEWAMQSVWIMRALKLPFLVSLPWFVVAATALFLVSFIWDGLQSQRITQALVQAEVPERIGEQFAPSVSAIGVMRDNRFVPYGTAWLYEHLTQAGPSSKWLVTNRHVVEQMQMGGCDGPVGTRPAVARFPASPDGEIASETLQLETCPRLHPLFAAFEAFRFPLESRAAPLVGAGEEDAVPESGQQAVANLYDLAAFEVPPNALDPARRFLTLAGPSQNDLSPFDITPSFTQNLQPGRPVLILSYPTENQPFLADGVSSDPFQFRTSLQSKSNAMSRSIPGRSSNRTPALYSFSAKSAGGISGSPVIAMSRDGEPFVSGIVFAASFVRGETNSAGSAPRRIAAGDGTYALDATSLATIESWTAVADWQIDDEVQEIREVWKSWSNDRAPVDEARIEFSWRNDKVAADQGFAALRVCQASRVLNLSQRTREEDEARGESPQPIGLTLSASAQNTLITAERRVREDTDALIQMTVSTTRNEIKFPQHEIGLNQASYLLEKNAGTEIEIGVAGPYKSSVTLTVYEAVLAPQDCPTREGWK